MMKTYEEFLRRPIDELWTMPVEELGDVQALVADELTTMLDVLKVAQQKVDRLKLMSAVLQNVYAERKAEQ